MAEPKRKKITVVTPCFNEEENVRPLCEALAQVMALAPQYDYEHLFIDNDSKDGTQKILRELAARDPHVKAIFNIRNFGHIRSPYHGILQSDSAATILMVSDFQDPPELILEFLKKWEEGFKVVIGVKNESNESMVMFALRKAYYKFVNRLSDVELVKNFTGFGLYDRVVVELLRKIDDPYPYFRGLISELGFPSCKISFRQPTRRRGITKNNFYTLYDIAMLGITNHSKVPLRMATMAGFGLSMFSLFLAIVYFILKLLFWTSFSLGSAPVVIGLFFFSSVQLFFIGIIGEYVGSIQTQVLKRPLVVEKERIGFS
jgi:glycosyltransferase involved in cell wall biosynthesis